MIKISKFLFEPISVILITNGLALITLVSISSINYSQHVQVTLNLFLKVMAILLIGYFLGLLSKQIILGHYFRLSLRPNFEKKFIRIRFLQPLFLSWLFLSTIEILYSGGLPLLGYLGISSPSSSDFGIPLVHGLAMSIFYLLFVGHSINFFQGKKDGKFLVLFFIWALLLSHRGAIILVSLLFFFSYIFFQNSRNIKLGFGFFLILSSILSIFVLFGQLRGTATILPSATGTDINFLLFIWLYAYFVSSWVNFALTVDANSAVRVLEHDALNVTTGWSVPYFSYGVLGMYLAIFLIGIFCACLQGNIKKNFLPFKILFTACCTLLFFGDFLFNRAFLLNMVLSLLLASVFYFSFKKYGSE